MEDLDMGAIFTPEQRQRQCSTCPVTGDAMSVGWVQTLDGFWFCPWCLKPWEKWGLPKGINDA